MVETTVEIRFRADDEACVVLDTNTGGVAEQQAELVCFAHYAASIIVRLGPERALPLVHALTTLEDASTEYLVSFSESEGPGFEAMAEARVRVVDPDGAASGEKVFRVLARFLDKPRAPRMFFRLKARGVPSPTGVGAYHASASVNVLLYSLLKRRAADPQYLRRLARTAGLIGRLGADGEIVAGAEFDVALAAAEVAWGPSGDRAAERLELQCPACGARGEAFEVRLWPGDLSGICECVTCGAGLWLRARRRPRVIAREVWSAMETLRAELGGAGEDAPRAAAAGESAPSGESPLLEELRRVFVENRWPFSEVRKAHALLSELSGPLGTWKFYAQVVDEQQLILLFSVCPLEVPEDRRSEVSHFLTRANYGLSAGNFELDFADGEVRYKTALHVSGPLDAATFKKLVRANGVAMETYLPGIGAVITGTPALPALERRALG